MMTLVGFLVNRLLQIFALSIDVTPLSFVARAGQREKTAGFLVKPGSTQHGEL